MMPVYMHNVYVKRLRKEENEALSMSRDSIRDPSDYTSAARPP